MNENNLFYKDDLNGNPMFYLDQECTKPYTGHTEDYFKEHLSREGDVVNGYYEGIYKGYYDYSGKLEIVSQMEHNLTNGLSIEFFENGQVRSISLVFHNWYFDSVDYNENGEVEEENLNSDEKRWPHFTAEQKDEIYKLREKYNLKEIHEEIMREGKNFKYEKYFE